MNGHLSRLPNLKLKIIECTPDDGMLPKIGYFMRDIPYSYELKYLQKEDDKDGWIPVEILVLSKPSSSGPSGALSILTKTADGDMKIVSPKLIGEYFTTTNPFPDVSEYYGEIVAMVNSCLDGIPNLPLHLIEGLIVNGRLGCEYIDRLVLVDSSVYGIFPWSLNQINYDSNDKSWAW